MQGWEQGSVLAASRGPGPGCRSLLCVCHLDKHVCIWVSGQGVCVYLWRHMLLGGYGDVCQWVGQSSVTVCVRICEWVYWEGPFWEWIGVCMCESVCVSVFGWGALMYVCVGAGDLWGVSVFVRVGGSLV